MKLILILVSFIAFHLPAENTTLTNAERRFAIRYLHETQRNLEKAIKNLTESQLHYRNRQYGWSIADCLEHLAIIENGVLGMVKGNVLLPAEPERRNESTYTNEKLIQAVMERPEKLSRPDLGQHASKYENWTTSLAAFNTSRETLKSWIESTNDDLHGHFLPHPVFGLLDTYQWIILQAAHCQRHILQIEDAKNDPRFPKNK